MKTKLHHQKDKTSWLPGYNLVEVIIALGVIAVALPLSMALIVATSTTTKHAEEETRATFMAREVFQELRQARDGQGQYITEQLSWPNFPGGDSWLVFYADSNGKIIGQASSQAYREGIKLQNAAYLLAVRGKAYEELEEILPQSGSEEQTRSNIQLSLVELRVELPAAATAENRRMNRPPMKFVQLMPSND